MYKCLTPHRTFLTAVETNYPYKYIHMSTNAVTFTPLPRQYQPTPSKPYTGLEYRFTQILKTNWHTQLQENLHNNTVITISGDQATGKSTLSKNLAKLYNTQHISAGTVFRQLALQRNISVAELSTIALHDISIDVNIDYKLALYAAAGSRENKPLIVEGRNPAVLGTYIKSQYHKHTIYRIYLQCSIVEQALRYIEREAVESLQSIKHAIQHSTTHITSLNDICSIIANIDGLPHKDKILNEFRTNVNRDRDDRKRYELLYGKHKMLDYRNPELYDIVIDTTKNQSTDTYKQIIAALNKLGINTNSSKL